MTVETTPADSADALECVRLRGLTRENAITEKELRSKGITAESWAKDIETGAIAGWICRTNNHMVGYCFGAPKTGEVVVLALLPEYEGQGLGRSLLNLVVQRLWSAGHSQLFLGCASDPQVRSYGFYRSLGWRSIATVDQHGDEVLVLEKR